MIIIEICPNEPRTSACLADGGEISSNAEIAQDFADCRASGDNEEACRYVLRVHKPEFRIVARNAAGEYENRIATDAEKAATARAIYFDSERDFADDNEWTEIYLVWSAASDLE